MKWRAVCSLVLAAIGCSPGSAPDDADAAAGGDGAPGAADASAVDGGGGMADASATLNGTAPASPKPAPEFTVLNRDGATRTKANLIGRPTVMWFYPAAFTGG